MANFFINYSKIDLEILETTIKNLPDKESKELKIEPRYLGMSYMKRCDFCENIENEDTLADEIIFLFGYQVCNNCFNKDISKTFIKKWCIDNKTLTCKHFFKNIDKTNEILTQEYFNVQRSNLEIESGWAIDSMEMIRYKIREDNTEDLEIPMYRPTEKKRHIQKHVFLSELCRFNPNLSELKIINEFKEILKKLK